MSGRDEQDEERTRRFYDAMKSLGVDSFDLGPPIQVFVPEEDAPMTPERRELLRLCDKYLAAFDGCYLEEAQDGVVIARALKLLLTDREGFVTVPREPTNEMVLALMTAVERDRYRFSDDTSGYLRAMRAYQDLIAAATEEGQ